MCKCEGSILGVTGVEGRQKLLRGLIFPFSLHPYSIHHCSEKLQSAESEPRDCFVAVQVIIRGHLVSCQLPGLLFWWQMEAMGPLFVVCWSIWAHMIAPIVNTIVTHLSHVPSGILTHMCTCISTSPVNGNFKYFRGRCFSSNSLYSQTKKTGGKKQLKLFFDGGHGLALFRAQPLAL